MIAGGPEPARQTRRQDRRDAAEVATAEQLRRDAEARLEGVERPQIGQVGGVPCDLHGAARSVADVQSGGVGEFGGERGIARRRFDIERQQIATLVVQLSDRSEHAGGRVPRAGRCRRQPASSARVRDVAGRGGALDVAVDRGDRETTLRAAPGDGEADDPGTHDDHVSTRRHPRPFLNAACMQQRAVSLGFVRVCDSLRRHYPDQVRRSAAPSSPLSPVHWAPVRWQRYARRAQISIR
jgi:hypothetical protein